MKKTLASVMMVFCVILFFACSSDNSGSNQNNNNKNETNSILETSWVNEEEGVIIVFEKNGKGYSSEFRCETCYKASFNYEVKDDKVFIYFDEETAYSFDYDATTNTFTLESGIYKRIP